MLPISVSTWNQPHSIYFLILTNHTLRYTLSRDFRHIKHVVSSRWQTCVITWRACFQCVCARSVFVCVVHNYDNFMGMLENVECFAIFKLICNEYDWLYLFSSFDVLLVMGRLVCKYCYWLLPTILRILLFFPFPHCVYCDFKTQVWATTSR